VSAVAIPGQISLGALSDRIGREWVWSIGCAGFAICCVSLIILEHLPSPEFLYLMVIAQGFLGYALPSVMGAIVAEIFEGPHYGSNCGTLTVALIGGGRAGPWITGVMHDATGCSMPALLLALRCAAVSVAASWLAAPRKVRLVPGRAPIR
jgi:MFS family permease